MVTRVRGKPWENQGFFPMKTPTSQCSKSLRVTVPSIRLATQASPVCLFGMRHCVMGRFADDDQIYVHLHFGGTDGHEHRDCLNQGLWALGGELLSEGEYKEYGNQEQDHIPCFVRRCRLSMPIV